MNKSFNVLAGMSLLQSVGNRNWKKRGVSAAAQTPFALGNMSEPDGTPARSV
ncbi:hypothetical protein [Paraburkholderia sp. BL25I1N1]|uniref:hypothetical protein n=1 Tax=Paraburkholderia sp. BL25I1N1 TaxID=1938804 RepID=UPI0015E5A147|nr:hypothetical protein [Paraburkholderia sp. BL25I1N1]